MQKIIFVTGNQNKADYLAKFLGLPIEHKKIDLDELQSLDLAEIIEHKVMQAYQKVKNPVIVEDVSLEFCALGKLPGPFIRFFLEQMSLQEICSLLKGKNRRAIARCAIGYYDGKTLKIFEKKLLGTIAMRPSGKNGFGWDHVFIPDGYTVTRAALDQRDYQKTYLRYKPIMPLKKFLQEQSI